jgi:hypothetical protein
MPSFGGTNIFGTAVSMSTTDHPRVTQVNAYFGLNGLESLDGGMRGRVTHVTGLLLGSTPVGLATAEGSFRSFNDGIARILVDNFGTAWPSVRLEFFQPRGRVRQSPHGVFFRNYQARFFHLE